VLIEGTAISVAWYLLFVLIEGTAISVACYVLLYVLLEGSTGQGD